MKVAIITPFFYPHIGGMERSLFNLANSLYKENYNLKVFTSQLNGAISDQPFKIVRNQFADIVHWSKNIKNFIKSNGPFDVLIYGGIGRDILPGILDSLEEISKHKSKVILRIPTSDHIKRHLHGLNDRKILSKFNHIVCNDYISKNDLENRLFFKNVYYIPNAVDTDLYSPTLPFSQRAKTILYSGRISKRKNIEIILELAQILNNKFDFIIQGSRSYGEYGYYNRIINSFNQIRNVQLVEPCWENSKIFQKAGIFILPSEVEGCSNSLLEAMSSELYCFASNIVENKTILSSHGILFELDPTKMLNHLRQSLISLEDKNDDVKSTRKYIIENFSLNKILTDWVKIFNEPI